MGWGVMHSFVIYIFFGSVFTTFHTHAVPKGSGFCTDHGYMLQNGYRKPHAVRGHRFISGASITYYCNKDYKLRPGQLMQKCISNGTHLTWIPENPPKCRKYLIATEQMSRKPGDVYCTAPTQPIVHGTFKCCFELGATTGNSSTRPGFCCPERGLVGFVCDPGHSLKDQLSRWICGSSGEWLSMDTMHPGTMSEPPKCYENTTRATPNPSNDDMLKPVIGVAAGVLVVLTIVIVAAFCRPKLIVMKRRWRETRDDEDELIINGQRIVLPSYEEAVASRGLYLQLVHEGDASFVTDVPGPSHTQTQRAEDPQNQLSQSQPGRVCSLDEELLIPKSQNGNQTEGGIESRAQSLILKAGTSIDAFVVINQPPGGNAKSQATVEPRHEERIPCTSSQNSSLNLDALCSSVIVKPPHLSEVEVCPSSAPIPNFLTENECNLESIYPQTSSSARRFLIRPALFEEGSDLLNYPLIECDEGVQDQQSFTIGLKSESFASISGAVKDPPGNDDHQPQDEPEERGTKTRYENDEHEPTAPNFDDVHIVMSLQTPRRRLSPRDETGSTAV